MVRRFAGGDDMIYVVAKNAVHVQISFLACRSLC